MALTVTSKIGSVIDLQETVMTRSLALTTFYIVQQCSFTRFNARACRQYQEYVLPIQFGTVPIRNPQQSASEDQMQSGPKVHYDVTRLQLPAPRPSQHGCALEMNGECFCPMAKHLHIGRLNGPSDLRRQ